MFGSSAPVCKMQHSDPFRLHQLEGIYASQFYSLGMTCVCFSASRGARGAGTVSGCCLSVLLLRSSPLLLHSSCLVSDVRSATARWDPKHCMTTHERSTLLSSADIHELVWKCLEEGKADFCILFLFFNPLAFSGIFLGITFLGRSGAKM